MLTDFPATREVAEWQTVRDIEAEERALMSYALHNMDVYAFTRSKQSYERAYSALKRVESFRRKAV